MYIILFCFNLLCADALVEIATKNTSEFVDLTEARTFLEDLGTEAINSLTDRNLSDSDRKRKFVNLLEKGFAVNTIALWVLGSGKRQATHDQLQEYIELFRGYLKESYAAKFSQYQNIAFSVTGANKSDNGDALINSKISRRNEADVVVQWRVRKMNGNYRIVDVLVEGVSLSQTQKAEFASILNNGGMNELLNSLRRYR